MIAAVVTALALTGCARVNVTVNTGSVAEDAQKTSRQSVAGPYGQLSIEVPDDWECRICPMDNDEMSYGYYGFTLHPLGVNDGIVAIFCAGSFGVCGTNLKQEETRIAGKPAWIGTYDGQKRWDLIVIGEKEPKIVATEGGCDSWTDAQWDMVRTIVDSAELDPSVAEGGVWQYTPESEDTQLGVSMDLSRITPEGATVHFYRFDTGKAGELSYGDDFIIERQNAGAWEEVPMITENAAFNDIAHIIPENDTVEAKLDWEWLYGSLESGTYRIRKNIIDRTEDGYTEHELSARFLLAKSPAR